MYAIIDIKLLYFSLCIEDPPPQKKKIQKTKLKKNGKTPKTTTETKEIIDSLLLSFFIVTYCILFNKNIKRIYFIVL